MATITPRTTKDGETHYFVQVRMAGAEPEFATFERLSDAKRWAQEREVAIRERRRFGRQLSNRMTVAEAIDRFKADHLQRYSDTSRGNVEAMLAFWRERLGGLALTQLDPVHMTRAVSELSCSPARRNRYLSAFSRMFTVAVREWRILDHNPAKNVSRFRESPGRIRFLSDAERGRLFDACRDSRNPELHTLVLLALATGARQGELVRLEWSEVDLERGAVTFLKTKNSEPRTVRLSQPARDALLSMPGDRAGRVFDGFPRAAWERALEVASVPGFRFHDLRHSAASYLAMSGASAVELAAVLGHKTLAMVKRYAHLNQPHLDALQDRMTARFLTPHSPSDPIASD